MRSIDLSGGTEILSPATCRALLAEEEIGRLAVVADGVLDVLPVNYRIDGDLIRIRSNWGRKVAGALESEVVFEVDNYDRRSQTGWSVIVRGVLFAVTPTISNPGSMTGWAGPKDMELSITAREITGRRVDARFWH